MAASIIFAMSSHLKPLKRIAGGNFKQICLPSKIMYSRIEKCARDFHGSPFLRDIFNIQDVDDFHERVLKSSTPVVVDFHASWCGPCKLLGPRLESVMQEYHGKVHLAKVDVDDNADLALDYDVSAVPVVIGMRDGKFVDKFIGLKDEDELKSFVDKLVVK